MREIIFRGKTVSGEWVYGNYAHIKRDFSTVRKGHYISNSAGSPFAFMVRPETIGQYTGLKDKNGKMIFEGDKVKYTTTVKKDEAGMPISYIGVVEFWVGQSGIGYRYKSGTYTMMLKRGHLYNMEVI